MGTGSRSKTIHEWNYEIYTVWNGEIAETLAYANNLDVAIAAYEASLHTRSHSRIELRNKARVMRCAETGAHDSDTGKCEIKRRVG